MKKTKYIASIIVLTLLFIASCSTEKNPTKSVYAFIDVTDTCDDPFVLDFYVEEASLIPIPKEDLTFENLGQSGAEAMVDDLTSLDGFCSLSISSDAEELFKQVEELILDGKNSEARNLLATVLGNYKQITNSYKTNSSLTLLNSDHRQKIRDLLRAEAYDQKAGGDGQAYYSQAQSTFSSWAGEAIEDASVKELMRIAEEAAMLGLNDLKDDAMSKAREKIRNQLLENLEAFDPCIATLDDGKELIEALAKDELLGGESGVNQEAMDKLGQSAIKLGADPQVVHQHLGDHIEAPVCGFVFEWTRTVSDGWTFQGNGSSCDGINWEGSVALSGVNSTGISINSSGDYIFAIAEGTDRGYTTIQTSGVIVISGDALSFTDPILMQFVFNKDELEAVVTTSSDGSGRLSTPAGNIAFASVFTTEPSFTVELLENPDCEG